MSEANPVPVEHQIWKDMDPRFPSRLLEVVYVEPEKFVKFKVRSSGKIVQISMQRLRKHTDRRGYALVASPAPAQPEGCEMGKQQAAAPAAEDGKR